MRLVVLFERLGLVPERGVLAPFEALRPARKLGEFGAQASGVMALEEDAVRGLMRVTGWAADLDAEEVSVAARHLFDDGGKVCGGFVKAGEFGMKVDGGSLGLLLKVALGDFLGIEWKAWKVRTITLAVVINAQDVLILGRIAATWITDIARARNGVALVVGTITRLTISWRRRGRTVAGVAIFKTSPFLALAEAMVGACYPGYGVIRPRIIPRAIRDIVYPTTEQLPV